MCNDKFQKLVNVDEMARILGVTKWWLYDRTSKGQDACPHYKLGKYVKFQPDEVLDFFKQKERIRE